MTFSGVTAVRRREIDLKDNDRILSLLTLQAEDGAIELIFSGGAGIRLEMPKIVVHLEDIGDTWPTLWRRATRGRGL
ncbi:MAG: DUF2948 family protein [Aliidongia sp.]